MKLIETQIWEPVPEKPGYVRCVGQRKAKEVFNELELSLKEVGLYPDEYFLIDRDFDCDDMEFPPLEDFYCYAQWGGSEGIYIEVDLVTQDQATKTYKRKNFATGKTLMEDGDSFDRMQYIAGYIYKLFMGEKNTPARYIMIPGEKKKNFKTLQNQLHQEYIALLKDKLVHKKDTPQDTAEVALKSMIISVLPDCYFSDEKIKELLDSGNALDLLYELCKSILEHDAFEINDMISCCISFADEIKRKKKTTDE